METALGNKYHGPWLCLSIFLFALYKVYNMNLLVHPDVVEITRQRWIKPKIVCFNPETKEVIYSTNEYDAFGVLHQRDKRISRNQVRACLNKKIECPKSVTRLSSTLAEIQHGEDKWQLQRLNPRNANIWTGS